MDDVPEIRFAIGFEADDFAVKKSRRSAKSLLRNNQFGKLGSKIHPISAVDCNDSFVQRNHGADSVPFDFEQVIGGSGRFGRGASEHGLDRRTKPIDLRSIEAFEQPLILVGGISAVFSVQLGSLQTKIKAILFLLSDLITAEGEFPHHTAAVFAFRNCALKIEVLDRMVFDIGGKPFYAWARWQSFGDSPRFQHSILFEPQIIVEPRSVMAMNNESVPGSRRKRFICGC